MLPRRRKLASTLLLGLAGACALGACLLPQEDRQLNFPPLRNRPPRIVEQTVAPQNRVIEVPVDQPCPSLEFRFLAEDPDVDQALTVRWYIDYHVFPASIEDAEQTIPANGKPIRDEPADLTVNLNSGSLNQPRNFLQNPGMHVVEAILFDGRLGAGRLPLPIAPATDGGVENPSYAVSYAWVVSAMRSCPFP